MSERPSSVPVKMHFGDNAFTADGIYFLFERDGESYRCFADGVPSSLKMDGDMCIFTNEIRSVSVPWKNAVDAIMYGLGVSDFAKQVQRDLNAMSPLVRLGVMHAVIKAAKNVKTD